MPECYFWNRYIDGWNSLPHYVVEADNVGNLKDEFFVHVQTWKCLLSQLSPISSVKSKSY